MADVLLKDRRLLIILKTSIQRLHVTFINIRNFVTSKQLITEFVDRGNVRELVLFHTNLPEEQLEELFKSSHDCNFTLHNHDDVSLDSSDSSDEQIEENGSCKQCEVTTRNLPVNDVSIEPELELYDLAIMSTSQNGTPLICNEILNINSLAIICPSIRGVQQTFSTVLQRLLQADLRKLAFNDVSKAKFHL